MMTTARPTGTWQKKSSPGGRSSHTRADSYIVMVFLHDSQYEKPLRSRGLMFVRYTQQNPTTRGYASS